VHKKQIQKIVDHYNDDGVVNYLATTDDHSGYTEVYIEERYDKFIYITKDDINLWDYLEDCDITDFKFYKTVDLFKEVISE